MKKCLIVIDYQVDFVNGSLGFEGALQIEKKLAQKIIDCKKAGYEVIFTLDTHEDNYLSTNEGRHLPIPHCILGTAGHELYGLVKAAASDDNKRILKPSFGSGELYEYLKAKKYDCVELCGVVTDICVISNAVLAKTALPEARVAVYKDLVATANEQAGEAALTVLKSLQVELIEEQI